MPLINKRGRHDFCSFEKLTIFSKGDFIMQDVQNIPNPDINSTERNDDFGSHSDVNRDVPNTDVEQPKSNIPVPPDRGANVPIEEPPADTDTDEPTRIV